MSWPSTPPEGTDPWYAPFQNSWNGIKTYIDDLLNGHKTSGDHDGRYDAAGTAAGAVSDHEAAQDPHPGYLTEAEGDGRYETPAGAQGKVDAHEAEQDPHAQYLTGTEADGVYVPLSSKGQPDGVASLGTDGKVPEAQLPAGQAPVTDHGNLTGLGDDDHPHYLNQSRGDARYDAAGSAAQAVAAHEAEQDPHPDYLTETEGDGRYAEIDHVHDTARTYYLWNYGGSAVNADPGAGNMNVQVNGQDRVFAASKIDADGVTRNLLLALPGDNMTVTDDPDTPPVVAFARYVLTSEVVDNGTWVTVEARRIDTQGSSNPPPVGTSMRVYLNNAAGGGTGPVGIDDLTDVDTSTAPPQVDQVLKWDGTHWIPADDETGGGGYAVEEIIVNGEVMPKQTRLGLWAPGAAAVDVPGESETRVAIPGPYALPSVNDKLVPLSSGFDQNFAVNATTTYASRIVIPAPGISLKDILAQITGGTSSDQWQGALYDEDPVARRPRTRLALSAWTNLFGIGTPFAQTLVLDGMNDLAPGVYYLAVGFRGDGLGNCKISAADAVSPNHLSTGTWPPFAAPIGVYSGSTDLPPTWSFSNAVGSRWPLLQTNVIASPYGALPTVAPGP